VGYIRKTKTETEIWGDKPRIVETVQGEIESGTR
jgi:hypothetical protein